MATLQLPANNLANLANLPPGTKLYLTTNSKNPSGKGKLLLIPQGAILRTSSASEESCTLYSPFYKQIFWGGTLLLPVIYPLIEDIVSVGSVLHLKDRMRHFCLTSLTWPYENVALGRLANKTNSLVNIELYCQS